jgi:hypothetical protein
MHPTRTQYFLAQVGAETQHLRAFLKAQGEPVAKLAFPTVYALRDDQVVGVLGSHYHQGCLAAGPLVVATKRPAIVGLRLLEAYEAVLKRGGVRSYLFTIKKTLPAWKAAVEDIGLTPLRETPHVWVYRKEVT